MSNDLPLLEKRIEDLFGEEPFNQVDEKLFRWLMFAYFDKGSNIKNLDSLNFEMFKDKLTVLIDAVYQWHQSRMKLENPNSNRPSK
jgi:hypothetical protein